VQVSDDLTENGETDTLELIRIVRPGQGSSQGRRATMGAGLLAVQQLGSLSTPEPTPHGEPILSGCVRLVRSWRQRPEGLARRFKGLVTG
jgi:hypothetical protein